MNQFNFGDPGAPPLSKQQKSSKAFVSAQMHARAQLNASIDAAQTFLSSAPPPSANAQWTTHQNLPLAPLLAAAAPAPAPAPAPTPLLVIALSGFESAHAPYRLLQSLRMISKSEYVKSVSARETLAVTAAAASECAYARIERIFAVQSKSSRMLDFMGLLSKFIGDPILTYSVLPCGAVIASLDSTDGYRRTVIVHADGSILQRVTAPNAFEVARFNTDETLQK